MPNALLLKFESKCQPLISYAKFLARVGRSVVASSIIIAISLGGGMIGYHVFEHLSWIDAFANASMILSGMGPLNVPQTFGGKLFAGLYALYSGLVLIIAAGIILAPFVHRVLHRFHLQDSEGE